MKFFKRLGNQKREIPTPNSPAIKFNWLTWVPPLSVFFANLFLVSPLSVKSFPQPNFSAPLLPFLSGGQGEILKILVLGSYLLSPFFLYFLIWEITNRRLISLLTCLIYAISSFWFLRQNIFTDEAHLAAFGLFPLILTFFLRFLRQPTVNLLLGSAIGTAAIALISPFALFTFLIFFATINYSEMLLGHGRVKLFYGLLVLFLAAGVCSFWYHPVFLIKIFQAEHGTAIVSILWSLLPPSFFLIPVLGAFSFLLFDRKPNLQPVFLSLSQFFIFFMLLFIGMRLSEVYIPAPGRFLPEFFLSLAFLVAVLFVIMVETVRSNTTLILKLVPLLGKKLHVGQTWGSFIFLLMTVSVLSFLFSSTLFIRPYFSSLAEPHGQILGAQLNPSDGVSQIFGRIVTGLTLFSIGFLKLRTK